MERPPENNREILLAKLTNQETSLEERIAISHQLFPEKTKAELLEKADTDIKERPVRYFRLVTYEELKMILNSVDINSTDNSYFQEPFEGQSDEIKKALKHFLEEEGIYETFENEFSELAGNFTLENYRNFVQRKLPRIMLYKLHISSSGGGRFSGLTGLTSLSVGAPYQPPYDPSEERARNKEGLPVIEMIIPADQIHVHPLFKTMNLEMEKEVDVTDIKPEWVVDVYNGTQDFTERFLKDRNSVLYPLYNEKRDNKTIYGDHVSTNALWDILQEWKARESIADLIPKTKEKDIDEDNPDLQKPFLP